MGFFPFFFFFFPNVFPLPISLPADLGEENQWQHKDEDLPGTAAARCFCDSSAISCVTVCSSLVLFFFLFFIKTNRETSNGEWQSVHSHLRSRKHCHNLLWDSLWLATLSPVVLKSRWYTNTALDYFWTLHQVAVCFWFFLISILDDYLRRFASYFSSSLFHSAQIGLVCWKQHNVCVLNQSDGRNFTCQDLRLVVLFGFDILQGSGCRTKGEESCQLSATAEECICNIWYTTSAYWMNCLRTWVLRLFWEGLISLASAESRVDFNIAKQSHMANPKHPFLFTLKNLSVNKQRSMSYTQIPWNRQMRINQRLG